MRALRAIAVGSDEDAAQAALTALVRGTAVDAIAAGVFAAAARWPSVLLGPVQIVVGGSGAGLRAIDGRTRQPGLGVPRPRGFRPEDEISPAARVGVPTLPAAISTALATFGAVSLARALGPAIELARVHSAGRLAVLKLIAQRGPAALTEAKVASALVAAAGRVAGGLLSARDLDEARPGVAACATHTHAHRRAASVPWGAKSVRDPAAATLDASHVRILAALDRHGLIAVACYEGPADGVLVEELDLVAPFSAAPVLRGERRTKPGEPRAAAAPIVLLESGKRVDVGAGIAGAADGEHALGAWLLSLGEAEPTAGPTLGVQRVDDAARALPREAFALA